jgi:colicin import membrane protein
MSAASAVQRYAEQQRDRLEQIRAATEKERQLLQLHLRAPAVTADCQQSDPQSPGQLGAGIQHSHHDYGASPNSRIGADGGYRQPETQLERLAYGARPSVVIASQLTRRAQELQAEEEELRRAEPDLDAQERAMEARVLRLNAAKKELLQRLAMLQAMDGAQREAEQALDQDLTEVQRSHDAAKDRMREQQHRMSSHAAEQAQREAALQAARKKFGDKEAEYHRAAGRLRQQLLEQEDRVRSLEAAVAQRHRAAEDAERDAAREEMRLRDDELQALSDLRAEMERRQAMLAVAAARKA